eukprot:INCI10720.1.p1 GENE.INCI10720.1~~INCI10720.1.p1  ORF type:complete len:710 (+),score=111.49 INCI10720.1:76-2130(+)
MKLQIVVLAATVGVSSAFCPSYCSGHGECTENDICECFPGFGEADCSVRTCPSGLSWVVGTASELSELPTPNGPIGKHPYTECSSRGVCDRATGECECFDGYTGKACRRSACPNQCSGHGLCVADGDVRSVLDGVSYYGGDDDFLLSPQKQYWNAKMSHQCICDQQYTGYDCSTRICPVGLDPSTSCEDKASYSDIQAVSVLFGANTDTDSNTDSVLDDLDSDGVLDHNEAYLPENIEQFLTLTFTSQFNAQYETPPISYWDTAATVQQALISLPNFAIGDVQVYKMFPRDAAVDADSDGFDNNGNSPDGGRCATAYFREYQSTLCTTTAQCETLFPSLASTGSVICDVDILACVETHADCAYQDGETEFTTANCALNFEIDGLYRPDEDTDSDGLADAYYWGHRLTAFERNCQTGKFSSSNTKYALPCATHADCVSCAGWTQVTNGVCLNEGYCGSQVANGTIISNSISAIVAATNASAIEGSQEGCSVATFLVKFSDSSTPGVQSDLECTISNTDAVEAGASPMYRSSGLHDCSVTHVGVPAFTDGKIQDSSTDTETPINNELELCIAIGDDTLDTSMLAAGDCSGDTWQTSLSMGEINTFVAIDNGKVASVEGSEYPTSPAFIISGTDAVYTSDEIDNKLSASYDVAMPCSNKGACDYATGICQCTSGFTGSACQVAITYV